MGDGEEDRDFHSVYSFHPELGALTLLLLHFLSFLPCSAGWGISSYFAALFFDQVCRQHDNQREADMAHTHTRCVNLIFYGPLAKKNVLLSGTFSESCSFRLWTV